MGRREGGGEGGSRAGRHRCSLSSFIFFLLRYQQEPEVLGRKGGLTAGRWRRAAASLGCGAPLYGRCPAEP